MYVFSYAKHIFIFLPCLGRVRMHIYTYTCILIYKQKKLATRPLNYCQEILCRRSRFLAMTNVIPLTSAFFKKIWFLFEIASDRQAAWLDCLVWFGLVWFAWMSYLDKSKYVVVVWTYACKYVCKIMQILRFKSNFNFSKRLNETSFIKSCVDVRTHS